VRPSISSSSRSAWRRHNPPGELSLKTPGSFRWTLPLAFALVLAGAGLVAAAGPTPSDYRQAVQQSYDLVRDARPNDTATAQQALAVLEATTGRTQREIIADLSAKPPDFTDAASRLRELLDALDNPATTTDPIQAKQQLHDVLALHRYDAIHRPPTLLERIQQWLNDRFNDLLRFLFGSGGGSLRGIPDLYFYAFGVAVVAAVAVILFRSTRGRFRDGVVAGAPAGPRAPADYFAEADQLAAAGDRVGAIRALCAGVAATLAGERTWEGSPLTVREIFQRAPQPARLRPLLQPFEAAVYGGRDVDAETYARAAAVAASFRRPVELAA
jgi:hypothetical protein